MILLVGSEKGGSGKSTIATNMAAMAARKGRKVLLVDTDRQPSSSLWAGLRQSLHEDSLPKVALLKLFGTDLGEKIKALSNEYEDILIDAGGRDSVELRAALLVADVLLVPVRASQFDLWGLTKIDDLVTEAKKINSNLSVFAVLNFGSTNPNVREAQEAREFVESEFPKIVLARTVLSERIAFRRAAGEGKGVIEYAQDPKASGEMRELFKEIFVL